MVMHNQIINKSSYWSWSYVIDHMLNNIDENITLQIVFCKFSKIIILFYTILYHYNIIIVITI